MSDRIVDALFRRTSRPIQRRAAVAPVTKRRAIGRLDGARHGGPEVA